MAISFTVPSGTQTGTFAVNTFIDDGNVIASIDDADFSIVSGVSGVTYQVLNRAFNASRRSTSVIVAVIPPANQSGSAQLRIAADSLRVLGASTTIPSSAQTSASTAFDTDGTPAFNATIVSQSVETNGDFEIHFRFSEMITAISFDILHWRDFIWTGAQVTGVDVSTGDWQNYRLNGTAIQTEINQTLSVSLRSRRARKIEFSNGGVDYTGSRFPDTDLPITTLTIPATGALPRPADTTNPSIDWTTPSGTQTAQFSVSGTWSHAVANFTAADIVVTPSTASATGFTYDTSTRVFSLNITPPTTGSGNIVVTVPEARVIPRNLLQRQSIPYAPASAPAPSPSAPTLSWLSPTRTQYTDFTVAGVFSAAVTGFDSSKLIVSPGGISNFNQSGNTFTFTVTPPQSGSGNISISIDTNGLSPTPTFTTRLVPYAQPIGVPTTPTIEWDISSRIQTGTFEVEGTWSLPVLNFEASDLKVSGGSAISGFSYNSATRVFRANITPPSVGQGTLTVFVDANAVSPANTRQSRTVSFNQPSFINWTYPFKTQFSQFRITGVWNTTVSDFTEEDIRISEGTKSDFEFPYLGDSQQFSLLITPPSNRSGSIDISINAGSVNPPNDFDSFSIPYGAVTLRRFPTRPLPEDRPTIVSPDVNARTNILYPPIHYLRGRNAYSVTSGVKTPAPEVQDNDYRTFSTETTISIDTFGVNQNTPSVINYVFVKCSGVSNYSLTVPAGAGSGGGFANRVISEYTEADGITVDTFYADARGRIIQHDFAPLNATQRLTATEVQLNFTGSDIRIYEIMLMQGILVIQPEELFTNIEHTRVSNSISKTNIRGENFNIRSLASRSKWSSRYTAFFSLDTELAQETLIEVIENNKNFVFVPEWNRFPPRVYLATWGTSTFPSRYRSTYINGGSYLDFEVLEL